MASVGLPLGGGSGGGADVSKVEEEDIGFSLDDMGRGGPAGAAVNGLGRGELVLEPGPIEKDGPMSEMASSSSESIAGPPPPPPAGPAAGGGGGDGNGDSGSGRCRGVFERERERGREREGVGERLLALVGELERP